MKMINALLFGATMSLCVAAVAMAETSGQVVNEKDVTTKVKKFSSNEKMMPKPEVQLERLTEGLKLTADQQKQISPILVDEYAKLLALRQDDNINLNLSPKQIQVKVEELRNEAAAKIMSFLTPEQSEKYDIVRKEIKANKKQRIKENRKDRIGIRADSPT